MDPVGADGVKQDDYKHLLDFLSKFKDVYQITSETKGDPIGANVVMQGSLLQLKQLEMKYSTRASLTVGGPVGADRIRHGSLT